MSLAPQRNSKPMSGTVVSVSRNEAYSFTKPVRDEIVLVAGLGIEGDVHAGERVRHRSRMRADPAQPNLRQVHLIQGELFGEVGEKGYDVGAGQLGENVTTSGLDLLGLPLGTILRFGPPPAHAAEPPRAPEEAPCVLEEAPCVLEEAPCVLEEAPRVLEEVPGAPGDSQGRTGTGRAGGSASEALTALFAAAAGAELDGPSANAVAALRGAVAREADQRGPDPRPAIFLAGLRNPCAQINRFRPGLLKEVLGRDAGGNLVRKAGVMAVVLRGGVIRPGDLVTAELPPEPLRPLERV